ncbi:MAG: hypothetical protein K8T10_16270 [Candidatus Eremiobacteraeota bacterium]|nr:hypothetical protein [Candidatus Eremiobacteraeota bacterium]
MKKIVSFVGLSLLIFLSAIVPAEAKQKRRNLDYSNPHNVKWEAGRFFISSYIVIKIYHNKQYKKDKDLRICLSQENGDSFLSSMYNIHRIKERPIVLFFPDSFGLSLRGRWDTVTYKGFYYIGLSLDNNFIEGIGNCFIFFKSSRSSTSPYRPGKKVEPFLPYDKTEFYDFSNMPVNRVKENPHWKVTTHLKYNIFFHFGVDSSIKIRYKGEGKVKCVMIGPNKVKYISKTKKLLSNRNIRFNFPKDFSMSGSSGKLKIENGYHRYCFIVDGVKIINRQNGFIIIHHSDNKSIPTCNIIHFYDCRKLYREFVKNRKEVEKELNLK